MRFSLYHHKAPNAIEFRLKALLDAVLVQLVALWLREIPAAVTVRFQLWLRDHRDRCGVGCYGIAGRDLSMRHRRGRLRKRTQRTIRRQPGQL